jgi:hydroxymethylpyrimidine/phosphomethylpyrimidine kinase
VGPRSPFIALSIAGSDPTGGAGVQGDLKTFAAHGVYGAAVVTAVTAQNWKGVFAARPVEPDLVAAQVDAVLDQVVPGAAKTGMLGSAEVAAAVAGVLARRPISFLVVDPVLVATSGGSLAEDGLLPVLAKRLFPLATLVTPNLLEAGAILGRTVAEGEQADAARAIRKATGAPAVLVKGGHGTGPAVDALSTASGDATFSLPRVDTVHGHGAGCALSASIAARLAKGDSLPDAVRGAKAYVHRAHAAARPLGGGRGPVAHDVPT